MGGLGVFGIGLDNLSGLDKDKRKYSQKTQNTNIKLSNTKEDNRNNMNIARGKKREIAKQEIA